MIRSRQVPESGKPCWPPRKLTHPNFQHSVRNAYNLLLAYYSHLNNSTSMHINYLLLPSTFSRIFNFIVSIVKNSNTSLNFISIKNRKSNTI